MRGTLKGAANNGGPSHLSMNLPLESLEAAHFGPHLHSPFRLHLPGGEQVSLELIEVKVLGHRRTEAIRDPFSLTFQGEAGWRLPQGIYPLEHEAIGLLEIFLTQVGDGKNGSLVEAIFT